MIDVWIIEDNEGFRKTVTRALGQDPYIHCSASFAMCEPALQRIAKGGPPQILLLDIELPGMSGVEGVRKIKERSPETRVVMLTTFDDYNTIFQALCGGADGYILKTAGLKSITHAIHDVAGGGSPISPQIARSVLNLFSRFAPAQPDYHLSPRERQVLNLLVEGLSKKEVAARLDLSAHTVDKYIRTVYEKLEVHSRSAAVAKAVKERLF